VSYLFNSVALNYGEKSVGILLTGMGTDGAKELKLMRECGAVTFAQDEESSVVYGMPGEAARIGAAQYIMPVDKIAYTLLNLIGERNGKS
jgi:two-component system chemotaxis response regulator CheB